MGSLNKTDEIHALDIKWGGEGEGEKKRERRYISDECYIKNITVQAGTTREGARQRKHRGKALMGSKEIHTYSGSTKKCNVVG